jgi:excisionase family DNA binding protein
MENQPALEKQVLSRMEAAAYLGVHYNTIDRSDIPRIRIGGRTLFRKKALDKYLVALESAPKPRGRSRCKK